MSLHFDYYLMLEMIWSKLFEKWYLWFIDYEKPELNSIWMSSRYFELWDLLEWYRLIIMPIISCFWLWKINFELLGKLASESLVKIHYFLYLKCILLSCCPMLPQTRDLPRLISPVGEFPSVSLLKNGWNLSLSRDKFVGWIIPGFSR